MIINKGSRQHGINLIGVKVRTFKGCTSIKVQCTLIGNRFELPN